MAGRPNSLPDSGTPVAVGKPLWDVKQAAEYLNFSESWVRRHLPELPHTRHGRSIRFDPDDLKRTVANRKSLEPRKVKTMNRRQRGGAILVGNVWYGTWRLDLPDGEEEADQVPHGNTRRDRVLQTGRLSCAPQQTKRAFGGYGGSRSEAGAEAARIQTEG